MTEAQIEKSMEKIIRDRGGLCWKFVSPNLPGVPDRIVVLPGGHVIFVELKTEVGRVAKIQSWIIGELHKRGADVRILRGLQAVKNFVEEVLPQ